MAKSAREKIKLESSAGTGHFYTTSKNKRTMTEKMEIKKFDPKARKLFPLRLTNFFTDISKIKKDLNWSPKYDLLNGLIDSYENDYSLAKHEHIDFSSDYLLFD